MFEYSFWMAQRIFGSGRSTGDKLEVLSEYVQMYQKAIPSYFSTIYFDGFAGSGEVPLPRSEGGLFDPNEADAEVLVGSAVRAAEVQPPFSEYHFVDKRKACIERLREKFTDIPTVSKMNFHHGDANELAARLCEKYAWKGERALFFLDPFGSQVEWSTIEAIAATRAIDLCYLFPAGVSVFRQVSNKGTVDPTHVASLNRIFGTQDWMKAFVKPSTQQDLFGDHKVYVKEVTAESAARYMQERMKGIFAGGVMETLIPLGKHSYPSYYLLFAWGNPSKSAKQLASKLSKAAVKAVENKYGRTIGY